MYPWLWLWSPQLHFPWSGSVAQRIAPETSWFFDAIPARSGIGSLEKQVFESDSYGAQLGTIIDALLSYIDQTSGQDAALGDDIRKLRELSNRITEIKNRNKDAYADQALAVMKKLRALDDDAFRSTLREILAEADKPLPRADK